MPLATADRCASMFRSLPVWLVGLGLVAWSATAQGQAPRYGEQPATSGATTSGQGAPVYGENQLATQPGAQAGGTYPAAGQAQSAQPQPSQYPQQPSQGYGAQQGPQPAGQGTQGSVTPQQIAAEMQREPAVPVNPFNVSAAEVAWIDGVLKKWETDSDTVKTFYAEFERDEFNQFGPPGMPMKRERGKLGYITPDQGSYEITDSRVWQPAQQQQPPAPGEAAQPQGSYVKQEGVKGDHWVCDGKHVYEHRFNTKQLVVIPIPPDMQGKEIVNGPLPFLFGAKAEDLKQRYWFRVARELCDEKFTRIGIHAKPKFQADLANFTDVYVILRNEPKELLMPMSMRLVSPDRSHADYRFNLKEARINARLDQWFSGMFLAPRTPFGWTRVDEPLQQSAQAVPAAGGVPAANGAGQPQRQ